MSIIESIETMDCPQCGQDMNLPANETEIHHAFFAIIERAERISEGEDWDILEFVFRKRDKVGHDNEF